MSPTYWVELHLQPALTLTSALFRGQPGLKVLVYALLYSPSASIRLCITPRASQSPDKTLCLPNSSLKGPVTALTSSYPSQKIIWTYIATPCSVFGDHCVNFMNGVYPIVNLLQGGGLPQTKSSGGCLPLALQTTPEQPHHRLGWVAYTGSDWVFQRAGSKEWAFVIKG